MGFSLFAKEGTLGLLVSPLEAFQISAQKGTFGLSGCSHIGLGGFPNFPPKMTFWLSGFCQRRNFGAFLFLPKKELVGVWAFWFLPKKEHKNFPI